MSNQIHPCDRKASNGGQCFNCLNGAHEFCPHCGKANSKRMGVSIVLDDGQRDGDIIKLNGITFGHENVVFKHGRNDQ